MYKLKVLWIHKRSRKKSVYYRSATCAFPGHHFLSCLSANGGKLQQQKKKIIELPYIPQKSCERFLCSKVDKEGQGKLRVYKFVLVIRKAYVFGREKQKCPKFSLKSSRFSRTWDWFEKYSRRSWDVYHQDNLSWREVGFNSGKIFFAMETA